MSAWRRLTFSIAPALHEDLIVLLHEAGSLGVEVAGGSLAAYFPATLDETALLRDLEGSLGPASGLRAVASEPVADGFWHERWMESLQPFAVGDGFLVVPGPATPADAAGRRVIRLAPGRAFGTGEHATTRMCLALIERDLRKGDSLLDVGTGSGILAIAAHMIGAGPVIALDIDETALETASRNAELNQAGGIRRIAGSVDALRCPAFDLVAANITGASLLRLMASLADLTRRELILSGILDEEERDLIQVATSAGLDVSHRMAEAGWVALALRRPDLV